MRVSVRLDDISPLIQYTGEWVSGSANNDGDAFKYSDGGTFKVTTSNLAKASIAWSGSQIAVFGAKRFNHKEYTVTVDGGQTQTFDGQADPGIFQTPLYQSPILANGQHQLVLQDASTDPDRPYLDVDFITIESEVEGDNSVTIEDDDPAWSYAPSTSWSSDPSQFTEYSGATGHTTRSPSATATLQFQGTAIDLYGLICEQCGGYWVSVDGGDPVALNSHNADWTKPKSMLFMARGLPEGRHSLTVTNLGQGGAGLSLDYAVAYGSQPRGIVASAMTGPAADNAKAQSAPNGVSTITLVLAVIIPLLIIIIGLLLLLFLRNRRIWPFNTPLPDDESFRTRSQPAMHYVPARSLYPNTRDPRTLDPRTLDIDGGSTIGSSRSNIIAVPRPPVMMYNAEQQQPEYPYASQPVMPVASGVNAGYAYDGSPLPTYGESVYDQQSTLGMRPPPEKGRYRRV